MRPNSGVSRAAFYAANLVALFLPSSCKVSAPHETRIAPPPATSLPPRPASGATSPGPSLPVHLDTCPPDGQVQRDARTKYIQTWNKLRYTYGDYFGNFVSASVKQKKTDEYELDKCSTVATVKSKQFRWTVQATYRRKANFWELIATSISEPF